MKRENIDGKGAPPQTYHFDTVVECPLRRRNHKNSVKLQLSRSKAMAHPTETGLSASLVPFEFAMVYQWLFVEGS